MLTNMYPTPEEPWVGCFVKDQVEDLRALGIEVEVLHVDGRRSSRAYLHGPRRLRNALRGDHFDLVHAHYGLTGAVALAQSRVPVVTTFHGGDYTGEVWWQTPVSWVVARRTKPIFVSPDGPRRLRCLGAPVIPAAVDTDLFQPADRETARARLGWPTDRRYALFPSSPRHHNKRVDLFEAGLHEARRSEPELEGVYLEGFVRSDVALLMNAIDVTVLTSNCEGSPVTVRESLACRTPVVSVPVGDVAGTLAGLPGCTVAPRDPISIGRGIVSALSAGRPAELRDRALQTARAPIAERVAKVYESVVDTARI